MKLPNTCDSIKSFGWAGTQEEHKKYIDEYGVKAYNYDFDKIEMVASVSSCHFPDTNGEISSAAIPLDRFKDDYEVLVSTAGMTGGCYFYLGKK